MIFVMLFRLLVWTFSRTAHPNILFPMSHPRGKMIIFFLDPILTWTQRHLPQHLNVHCICIIKWWQSLFSKGEASVDLFLQYSVKNLSAHDTVSFPFTLPRLPSFDCPFLPRAFRLGGGYLHKTWKNDMESRLIKNRLTTHIHASLHLWSPRHVPELSLPT